VSRVTYDVEVFSERWMSLSSWDTIEEARETMRKRMDKAPRFSYRIVRTERTVVELSA
jgi:hypothetical protein